VNLKYCHEAKLAGKATGKAQKLNPHCKKVETLHSISK